MQTVQGFKELESDELSIGYRLETGETSPSFRTLPLDLSKAISLVIVSDGILDQKGGAKGLSLGRRRLKNLLEKTVTENTGSEVLDGDYLMRAIHEYQGDEEQRDDMTLIVLPLEARGSSTIRRLWLCMHRGFLSLESSTLNDKVVVCNSEQERV